MQCAIKVYPVAVAILNDQAMPSDRSSLNRTDCILHFEPAVQALGLVVQIDDQCFAQIPCSLWRRHNAPLGLEIQG